MTEDFYKFICLINVLLDLLNFTFIKHFLSCIKIAVIQNFNIVYCDLILYITVLMVLKQYISAHVQTVIDILTLQILSCQSKLIMYAQKQIMSV